MMLLPPCILELIYKAWKKTMKKTMRTITGVIYMSVANEDIFDDSLAAASPCTIYSLFVCILCKGC